MIFRELKKYGDANRFVDRLFGVALVAVLGACSDSSFSGGSSKTSPTTIGEPPPEVTPEVVLEFGSISGFVNQVNLINDDPNSNSLESIDIGLQSPYSSHYQAFKLGRPSSLPSGNFGGISISPVTNKMLIPISSNIEPLYEAMYEISVKRDAKGRITGLQNDAKKIFDLPAPVPNGKRNRVDGGNAFHPDGTLFLVTYPSGNIFQYSRDFLLIGEFSGGFSGGALNFVPSWHGAAGKAKYVTWHPTTESMHSTIFDVNLSKMTADATSFSINLQSTGLHLRDPDNAGPEGFAYVPIGSKHFEKPSVLVSEWSRGRIVAYEIDQNANPILSTRAVIAATLPSVEGAFFDDFSGDFVFSTWPNSSPGEIVIIRGFTPPRSVVSPLVAKVFIDVNANGAWDVGEPQTMSDSLGQYKFGGLALGRYQVGYIVDNTGSNLAIGVQNVELSSSKPAAADVNFSKKP